MHASTRVLLLLAAIAVLLGGIWILFSINTPIVAAVYAVGWAVAILIGTRLTLAVGAGFNRFQLRHTDTEQGGSPDSGTALTELSDLRERGLITPEEFDAKRAGVLRRL